MIASVPEKIWMIMVSAPELTWARTDAVLQSWTRQEALSSVVGLVLRTRDRRRPRIADGTG